MLDTLNATPWTHKIHGAIYQNSYGTYWVVSDDGTGVSPLVWGRPYNNNVKVQHISEAEIDTFLKRPQSHFQIN